MPAILIFSQVSPSHSDHFALGLTGRRGQGTLVTESKCEEKAVEEKVMGSSLAIIVLTVTETELTATLSKWEPAAAWPGLARLPRLTGQGDLCLATASSCH